MSDDGERALTRRDACAAALTAASLAAPRLLAQEGGSRAAAGSAAPAVWRGMDQATLDAAYSQGPWAANMSEVLRRYATNSERVRAHIGEPRRLAYGESEAESLDLYVTQRAPAPIHVFVHGGAWTAGSAREHGFLAEPFVRSGAHFVALDFSSVRDTGGDLAPLADQVRRAIAWIYRQADTFGGDAGRIFVSGHSSGGHLAGLALTTDWASDFGVPADVLKGGLCCSGMFDLEPVSLSSRRDYLAFDDTVVAALSPQRRIVHLHAPLLVACGTLESPEFQRQSRDFAAAVGAAGKPAELIVGDDYNHFELIETLANPYGLVGRAALRQMRLA